MYACLCRDTVKLGDRNAKRVRVQFSSIAHVDISQFLDKVVAKSQIVGNKAAQLKQMGECVYERFSSSSCIALQEFLSICQEYRKGISENEWEKFAFSFVSECFRTRVNDEDLQQTLMRIATYFGHSELKDEESSGSSICAVMNMPLEESTLDITDDSIQDQLLEDSSLSFLTDNETSKDTYEVTLSMIHSISVQVVSQSCYRIKYTYICLNDVNDSSTEDEY